MPGLYAPFKVYTPGEVLTAADLNATDQNHITNQVPQMTDDYSLDLTQKRQQSDPTNTLATSLAIEIQQIRYVLAKLGGKTYWDEVTTGPGTGAGSPMNCVRAMIMEATGATGIVNMHVQDGIVFTNGIRVTSQVNTPVNLATAGPAAGGRDQAANFAHQWIHYYYITTPASSVSCIASIKRPTDGGPTMPGGYTGWAYAGSIRIGDANLVFQPGYQISGRGGYISYNPPAPVLNVVGSGVTGEVAYSIEHVVPTVYMNRWNALVEIRPFVSRNGQAHIALRSQAGLNERFFLIENGVFNAEGVIRYPFSEHTLRVGSTGASPLYIISFVSAGTNVSMRIDCAGYYVPNGDY